MKTQNDIAALVFNIQRYSIHDGPGIRTTLFLKGCPLRCLWCHNPEAISGRVQFGFLPERCIGCRQCIAACPHGVHDLVDGQHIVRWELCRGEGKCTEACYAEALERIGYRMTLGESLAAVERDRPFYERSGGGVTISGGEPARQPEFTAAFLAGCRERGLHAALDTCGYAPWEALAACAGQADLVLYDLKHMDSAHHLELTGVANGLILENLARLYAAPQRGTIWVRYPFIPGCNDGPEVYEEMACFLAGLMTEHGRESLRVDILPYHQLGQSKYRKLGLGYALDGTEAPASVAMDAAAAVFSAHGLDVHIGE